MQDIRLQIMRLLLNTGEDLSIREIARRLDLTSGHIFYHLKKLSEMGILKKELIENQIFYTPQNIFTSNIDETLNTIIELSKLIEADNGETISNCVMMFLKCYDSFNGV